MTTEPAGGSPIWMSRLAWLVVVLGVGLVAVGGVGMIRSHHHHHASSSGAVTPESVSQATTSTSLPPVTGPFAAGRRPLPGFGEVAVRISAADGTSKVLCMLLAKTLPQQERGLMGVTDRKLGGYDGMLFAFGADTRIGFWMRDTPMPLSIAYLDDHGGVVSTMNMAPCADVATCPSYPPGRAYRMAIEVPQGGLGRIGLGPSATVEEAGRCTAA